MTMICMGEVQVAVYARVQVLWVIEVARTCAVMKYAKTLVRYGERIVTTAMSL